MRLNNISTAGKVNNIPVTTMLVVLYAISAAIMLYFDKKKSDVNK